MIAGLLDESQRRRGSLVHGLELGRSKKVAEEASSFWKVVCWPVAAGVIRWSWSSLLEIAAFGLDCSRNVDDRPGRQENIIKINKI